MLAHSHGTTTKNEVYLRNANGTKGPMVYDTGCPEGVPCAFSSFDPEHIANRYFPEWLEINMNEGFIQSGTYVNNTGQTLLYGPNAETAEMLVFGYYYVLDTTGLGTDPGTNFIEEATNTDVLKIRPNPSSGFTNVLIETPESYTNQELRLQIFNATGQLIHNQLIVNVDSVFELSSSLFSEAGVYIISLSGTDHQSVTRLIRL